MKQNFFFGLENIGKNKIHKQWAIKDKFHIFLKII